MRSWDEMKCKDCGEWVTGEDLGDHELYLTFDCECGKRWSERMEDPIENAEGVMADQMRDREQDR